MNDNHHNTSDPGIPAELLGVASSLDRLGAAERAGAGDLFEARLAATTRPGMAIDESPVRSLARAERDAAPATFEDRIFMATRGLLAQPVAAGPEMRIHVRPMTRVLRVAAAVAIVAGAGLASYLSMPRAADPGRSVVLNDTPTADAIASQLEDDFADLASILSVALGAADSDTASSSRESLESSELEFPQFDLLSVDMEGSL